MKIALVIERMDSSKGGREISTSQIALRLAGLGHDVTIICQSGSDVGKGVALKRLGARGLCRSHRLANFARDVDDAVGTGRFEVVHAMLPMPAADVYQSRGGTIPGQIWANARRWGPLSNLRHALGWLNPSRRLAAALEQRVVADKSVMCLAVSHMVAEEFQRYYGRNERLRVIYNAVDVPDVGAERAAEWREKHRRLLGVGAEDPVFLTIARNFGLKGVADTISTFARWYHSHRGKINARLVVIGRENPENYQRHASLRDVGRLVLFVGPTDNVFEWYSAADICILLSWYDPCSRVVLEAVRWSVPAITTVFNGAAEILGTSGSGIVVSSPKDTRAIVAAMDEMADPVRRSARSEACVKAAGSLSVDRHVDDLLAVYAEAGKLK